MQNIIFKSKHLSSFDKKVLADVFENLSNEQKELFASLEKKTLEQIQPNSFKDWKVVTALIPVENIEEAEDNGFYEYFDYNEQIAFLNCNYSEKFSYMQKKYKALIQTKKGNQELEFSLVPFYDFYELEKSLEKTARQYEMDIPAIFSPFSRRAVKIDINLNLLKDEEIDFNSIDFQLEKNNLTDILLLNRTLVWNVKNKKQDEIQEPLECSNKSIYSLFEIPYDIYEFATEDNEFFYIKTSAIDVKRYKNAIYINKEQEDDELCYEKWSIENFSDYYKKDLEYSFENFYENKIKISRIRTKADIDAIFNQFKNDFAIYEGKIIQGKCPLNKIYAYERTDAYFYSNEKLLQKGSVIYVKFKKLQDKFFEDAVNYIMAFVNYNYPEFYFVGVY